MRKKAFTLIELTTAAVMLTVLSSVVIVNYTRARQTARDGIRRSDVQALLTGINQFAQVNGSTLIRDTDTSNKTLKPCAPATATDPSISRTGAGCVGAGGRAYGLANTVNATLNGAGGSTVQRVYTPVSMAQALMNGGYLSSVPRDPLAKSTDITGSDAGVLQDYAVIRACPNGEQHVGDRGQLVSVWAIMERGVTATDIENMQRVVGSQTAAPVANYRYDFAAGDDFQTLFEANGYGVSNGSSRPNVTGLSCDTKNS
jgi:type II secretory pathway pseudopilin PulG